MSGSRQRMPGRDAGLAVRRTGWPRRVARWCLPGLLWLAGSAAAQITYVGVETSVINGSVSALDIDRPPAVSEFDVMIAQVSLRASSGWPVTPPTGWSLLSSETYGPYSDGFVRQDIYFRIAGATEPSQYEWLFGSTRAAGSILAYGGVDTSDPVADVSEVAADLGTSVVAWPVTTVRDESAIIALFSHGNGNNEFSQSIGTARVNANTRGGKNGLSIGVLDGLLPSAGFSGFVPAEFLWSGAPFVAHTIALNPGAETVLDHIRIDHPGSAVTCEPVTVTLQACADAACTTTYPDPVTVTLNPAGSWGGGSNVITFTGSTTVTLSITTPQTVTLAATSNPVAINPTQCQAGAAATCDLIFADTGFVFSAIPVQTAGTESGVITLRAVTTGDDGTACSAAISGDHAIEFASECIDPLACAGINPTVSGVPVANNGAAAVASYSPVTLNFDASATAQFTLNYADVGMLQLHTRYTVANGAQLSGISNTFVERPAGFSITSITGNPAADDPSDPVFIGAGQPFTATVTALTSTGSAAPNFGNEQAPEAVQLTPSLELPVGGVTPPLDHDTIAGTAFAAGSATVSDLAWHEVGIIRLTGRVADGNYLGAGAVTGAPSVTIGRFVPDHFNVTVADGCAASGITYARQPFTVGVVAASASDATTSNYAGAFARQATLSNAGDSTHFSDHLIPAATFVGGVASATPSYANPSDPPQPPLMLAMRATDTDGVSSSGFVEDSTELRNGRLRLENVVSNALAAAPMPVRVESWRADGGGALGWMADSADTCTMLAAGDFQLSGAATLGTVTFAAGSGTVELQPTGAGNADVEALIDAAAANPLPWLQFDWDGDGDLDNPTARAGFGLNEGRDRQIFRREVIN